LNDRLARPVLRETHDGLTGAHHLTRFGERLDDHAGGVRHEQRVRRRVARDLRLRLGGVQLRAGRLCARFHSVVRRGRFSTIGDEVPVTRLVVGRLARAGGRRGDRLLMCVQRETEVDVVESHERLPSTDLLPGADESLEDLAGDAEAQIALYARRNRPRERARERGRVALNDGRSHERWIEAGIAPRWMAASRKSDGQAERDERGDTQELGASREHGFLSDNKIERGRAGVIDHWAGAR
jgi:hypothetical protein